MPSGLEKPIIASTKSFSHSVATASPRNFGNEYQDRDDGMRWKRCYGLEDWTFAADGKMRKRMMSGNDVEIGEDDRWFKDGLDVNEVEVSEEHW